VPCRRGRRLVACELDLAERYPGFIRRMCFFTHGPPALPEIYPAADGRRALPRRTTPPADYRIRRARWRPPSLRTGYPGPAQALIAGMYGLRACGLPRLVSRRKGEVASTAEPFADADTAASWGTYELAYVKPDVVTLPLMFQPSFIRLPWWLRRRRPVVPSIFG